MCMFADSFRESSVESLEEFAESLSKFTKYSSCRPLATLNYASDVYNTSSIVSSVEFDRDCDYFAIAGVTKKIKVKPLTSWIDMKNFGIFRHGVSFININ